MELHQYIDHTLLKPTATSVGIKNLCKEAIQHQFYAVCVHGSYVSLAADFLKGTPVKIAAVIGFPLGAVTTDVKVFEAKQCVQDGADEIDMVLNIGWLQEGKYSEITQEISAVKEAIGGVILKVIIETCNLSVTLIKTATQLVVDGGGDFVKTSTGFGTGGATVDAVEAMQEIAKNSIKIKASGGIKTRAIAEKYIEMGVSRLGTSSGISLLTDSETTKNEY